MGRTFVMLWALVALPFVVTAATGGPDGLLPHAVFHPVYIVFLVGAILVLVRLRAATGSRMLRALALALLVAQAVAIVGHIGEEIAVLQHGGLSAGEDIFVESLHFWSANLTVPGLLASLLLLIVITIAAILARRRERRHAMSSI